jgi:hypothetical protein
MSNVVLPESFGVKVKSDAKSRGRQYKKKNKKWETAYSVHIFGTLEIQSIYSKICVYFLAIIVGKIFFESNAISTLENPAE